MGKWEETAKSVCENGDLTHDFVLELARMLDRRDAEINRLQAHQVTEPIFRDQYGEALIRRVENEKL